MGLIERSADQCGGSMIASSAVAERDNQRRPDIPRPLEREVKVEAGHRCAIPTCRQTSGLQIHHIVDWAKVKRHEFHNLIYICAVCHARATSGEIDVTAMKQYKENLALVSGRYSHLERRIIENWAYYGLTSPTMQLSPMSQLHVEQLLRDGLVEEINAWPAECMLLKLTPVGREFLDRFVSGRELEEPALSDLARLAKFSDAPEQ